MTNCRKCGQPICECRGGPNGPRWPRVIVALALVACSPPVAPVPADHGCEATARHLAELHCEEAPRFVAACENAAQGKIDITCYGLVTVARDCAEARAKCRP